MGYCTVISLVSLGVLVVGLLLRCDCFWDCFLPSLPVITFAETFGSRDVNDASISPINIKVPEHTLKGLHSRLITRVAPHDYQNSNFTYGFNTEYHKNIIKYWLEIYQWRKWEDEINKMPHYFTKIKGLQIHFVHIKPDAKSNKTVIPILLLHGWPGSFFEFYKLIPQLVKLTDEEDFNFEIVCPSLVGYGWSDAATNPDFSLIDMTDILFNLMDRLNITKKFYIQGGDFGSILASMMTKIRPDVIAGIHLNFVELPVYDFRYLMKVWIGSKIPSIFHFLTEEELKMVYPWSEKMKETLSQLGYMWLQATRPHTLGIALSDSPAGLAAYILEKFGCWSNNLSHFLDSPSGGIEDIKISKDEMLTNVMIYYITNTISSSIMFYKDFVTKTFSDLSKNPVFLPTAIAQFPNELIVVPKQFAAIKYRNIRQFTRMPRGGHFAALEEPELLAEDIVSFIKLNTV